ncbi:Cof-type HAD-IIB family hydrolase [Arsenicicoccus sp. UBA7492]|uniref:Cof-type HAD-IIB family hydrolase n=1 Tax=Arsenicicoccus sp. UBA7492 TaxID=1946057 RepID=UPI00257B2EDE|nr:Cof-type HAD-IIB family hydrolase [Arsenicicoccus sp. UBA7492]
MPARPWTTIAPGPHDVRLVVADMDGTLLDESGAVPAGFWGLLSLMGERGITFVPASGRQLATLQRVFERAPQGLSYIAENGTLVVHDDEVVSTTTVSADITREVVDTVRVAAREHDLGLVVCGVRSAYVERNDPAFLAECERYYARLEVVGDLHAVEDDVLKLAVYDFEDAERHVDAIFGEVARTHQVVLSGQHWIDIMAPGVHKGHGVRALQSRLGVTSAQTVVLGDYLNDLQMLDTATWSFAMANAHPDLIESAAYLAPRNTEDGVVRVLTHLLGA